MVISLDAGSALCAANLGVSSRRSIVLLDDRFLTF